MAQRVVDKTISVEDLEKLETKKEETEKKVAKSTVKAERTAEKPNKRKKVRGAKYKLAKSKILKADKTNLKKGIETIKNVAFGNFTESIEVHVNLSIDPKDIEQRLRFTTTLPYGTGKTKNILVISSNNSGKKKNIIYRDESVVDEIINQKLIPNKDFDTVVATPDKMKFIAKAAKILGPRGMMPSPKAGTVTDKIEDVLKNISKGQIEVRSQPNQPVVHQVVGKINMKTDELVKNIETLISEIRKNRPSKVKGKLIKKITICSTMGPSFTYLG